MNSTHTPGPWKVDRAPNGVTYIDAIGRRGEIPICTVTSHEQDDARLIAAAPDLLEACRGMLRHLEREGLQFDAMDDARAAIAKATGKGE